MPSSETVPADAFNADSVNSLPIAFSAVFLPFVLLFVALRFYCRHTSRANWGFDDVLIAFAAVGQIALAAICIDLGVNGGSGYHMDYLLFNHPEKVQRFLVDVFALQIIYYTFLNVPKLAVLVLYHRIFSVRRGIIWVTRILMAVLVLYTIVSVFLSIFACGRHVDAFYSEDPKAAKQCIDMDAMQIYTSVPNIVTDVLILLVPMPVAFGLRVRMSVRLGIAMTFLMGSLGLVFSALRFWVTYSINNSDDQTYVSAELLVWSELEVGCYLISACLLILRPLIERIADSSLIQSLRSNTYGNRGTSSPGRGTGSKTSAATGEGSHPSSVAGTELLLDRNNSGGDIEMVNGLHFTTSK
ncbi:uncharacterized protein TRUGW13939_01344 [Talaromyces rugulosus]|uniref:Rhodopsin domain-containing protein n=1 Tax=Talaromyces rugulosus TaxID=121627 RepID=A0A7H8QK03_TALRU|nr:uncharacterized protein TRUGW13939_01344 [Talaromyces rugulosus]QKX54259.1 hypothetical protein TRUGW13939_01344 [Talaromyces rugulosus]